MVKATKKREVELKRQEGEKSIGHGDIIGKRIWEGKNEDAVKRGNASGRPLKPESKKDEGK